MCMIFLLPQILFTLLFRWLWFISIRYLRNFLFDTFLKSISHPLYLFEHILVLLFINLPLDMFKKPIIWFLYICITDSCDNFRLSLTSSQIVSFKLFHIDPFLKIVSYFSKILRTMAIVTIMIRLPLMFAWSFIWKVNLFQACKIM